MTEIEKLTAIWPVINIKNLCSTALLNPQNTSKLLPVILWFYISDGKGIYCPPVMTCVHRTFRYLVFPKEDLPKGEAVVGGAISDQVKE